MDKIILNILLISKKYTLVKYMIAEIYIFLKQFHCSTRKIIEFSTVEMNSSRCEVYNRRKNHYFIANSSREKCD